MGRPEEDAASVVECSCAERARAAPEGQREHHLVPKDLRKSLTTLPGYESFFSLDTRTHPDVLKHYGTATFVKKTACVPIKAEEGIGDVFIRDSSKKDEQIGGYPTEEQVDLDRKTTDNLDREGRVVVLDMGLFVLINVYSPNPTPDRQARYDFKCHFEKMLEVRVRNLVELGREVIVCGDLNIAASDLDITNWRNERDGDTSDWPPRVWFNKLTGEGGQLIDIWRKLHPGEKVLSYSQSARVDYFLITPALLPWVDCCEIHPHRYGSDHRPVLLRLHEQIVGSNGQALSLWEALNPGRKKEDPLPKAPSIKKGLPGFFVKQPSASLPTPSLSAPSSASLPAKSASSPSRSGSNDPFSTFQPLATNEDSLTATTMKEGKGKEKARTMQGKEKKPVKKQKKVGSHQQLSFPKQSTSIAPAPESSKFVDTEKRAATDEAGSSKKRSKTTSSTSPSSPPAASSRLQAHSQPINPAVASTSASDILDWTQDDEDEVVIL